MALRFPTADINSPAAAGVNCQEEGYIIGPLKESNQILAGVGYTLGYDRKRLTYKSMDMLGLRRTLTCM